MCGAEHDKKKKKKKKTDEQLSGHYDNKYYGREKITAKLKDSPEKYQELYDDCKQFVKEINQALDEHKRKFQKDWKNWSHGGDLGRVHYDLQTILTWLKGGK